MEEQTHNIKVENVESDNLNINNWIFKMKSDILCNNWNFEVTQKDIIFSSCDTNYSIDENTWNSCVSTLIDYTDSDNNLWKKNWNWTSYDLWKLLQCFDTTNFEVDGNVCIAKYCDIWNADLKDAWWKMDNNECVVEINTSLLDTDEIINIWETWYDVYINWSSTPVTLYSSKNYTSKINLRYSDNDFKIYNLLNPIWKIFQKNDFSLNKIEIKK